MHPTPTRPGRTATDAALVLVDFDDTLVDTAPRFQNARRTLFATLLRAGFDEASIRRVHHDEVDPAMIKRYGLGPFRLEPSFRETYLRLCAEARINPDPVLADECAALGHAVAGTPPPIEGALDALRRLADTLPTAIYTQSGHPDYQLACIRESGVLDVLPEDRVRICRHKTAEEYRATLAHFGVREPAAAWMVGNSMRSDVNPALANGSPAILVEIEDPWIFDLVEPVAETFIRVRSFVHAVGYLLDGDDGGQP